MQHRAIEKIEARQHVGNVGPHHADDFRVAILVPQRSQGRRRHDGVPDPVGQKEGEFHPAFRFTADDWIGTVESPRNCPKISVVEIPGMAPIALTSPP